MTARVRWLSRVVLGFATLIFFLIGFKYILDPVSAAASSGMSLPTALGLTNMRAGVGGFSIGCALIAAACLASRERLRLGLWFVAGILAPVLIVRLYGVAVDKTLEQSARILLPESLLLSLSVVALFAGASPLSLWPRRVRRSRPLPDVCHLPQEAGGEIDRVDVVATNEEDLSLPNR